MRTLAHLVTLIFCSVAAAQSSGTDPPTLGHVQALYDDGEYSLAIRTANRLLAIRATVPPDRYELLVIKGESHLRLGDSELAAKAFMEAAGVAPDELSAARARATALLIRRSKRNLYRSSSEFAGGEPLPIDVPDGRPLALRALYVDEQSAAATKLAASRDATEIGGLVAGLDLLLHLKGLELAATGGDVDTQALLQPLAGRARDLATKQLKTMSTRAERLAKEAEKKTKMGSHYRMRGLSADEIRELRSMRESALLLAAGAARFESADSAGGSDFADLRRELQQLATRIEQILTADYRKLHDRK